MGVGPPHLPVRCLHGRSAHPFNVTCVNKSIIFRRDFQNKGEICYIDLHSFHFWCRSRFLLDIVSLLLEIFLKVQRNHFGFYMAEKACIPFLFLKDMFSAYRVLG